MKNIEYIAKYFEGKGIYNELGPETGYIEFWTDTAGQDIYVGLEYENAEDFVKKFMEYAESYDVDDEVELYVGMRGKNGVPDTIREIMDDCTEAKETLMRLATELSAKFSNNTFYTVSIAVDGRIDVTVALPEGASKDDIRKAAMNAFGDANISTMEVVGSEPVNCSDENGDLIFDF